jgi:hypothetical protein
MDGIVNDSDVCPFCSKIMMYDADGRNYCNCQDDDNDSDWLDSDDDNISIHPFWQGLISDD